ncbi:MAG: hypothetical protein IPK16_31530 [Anaerolineales bacterium]|nr:hypothetical protein [Anaerolineales bacterium]
MKSQTRQRLALVVIAVIAIVTTWQLQPQPAVLGQTSPAPTSPPPTPEPTWTPVPTAPPGLPGITPSPTPDMRAINQIFSPKPGDAVAGFAAIVGSALIDNFAEYQVHISPAGMENWAWLQTSRKVVRANLIHALNTFLLQDGFYDLRVRAIRDDGNYSEAFLRDIEVRNANPPTPTPIFDALGTPQPASPLIPLPNRAPTATPTPRVQAFVNNGQGIYRPQNGDVVRGLTPIIGTVNGKTNLNPFAHFELAIAPSGTDQWGWLYTGIASIGNRQSSNGTRVRWQMDSMISGCASSIATAIMTNTM